MPIGFHGPIDYRKRPQPALDRFRLDLARRRCAARLLVTLAEKFFVAPLRDDALDRLGLPLQEPPRFLW
jgi:hypothetical protein